MIDGEINAAERAAQLREILEKSETGTVTVCSDCGWSQDCGGWNVEKCPICTSTDTRVKRLAE